MELEMANADVNTRLMILIGVNDYETTYYGPRDEASMTKLTTAEIL